MGDETQQMELLTLLKHDITMYHSILTPDELDVMSNLYDEVVRHSEFVLVGTPPSWFVSPIDLVCESGVYYLDAVQVSKCTTGEVLQAGLGDPTSWEDQEEACLRQAAVWADLNHPHVAKMLGACHIGKEPFVVHEPAEPLVSNRASAQSWEPLLGWALGLQYLHERELGYKNFGDSRLLARHHATASGVLSGLGLVPVKRQTSASLRRGVSNMFSTVTLAAEDGTGDENQHEWHTPTWSVPNDIFAFGLAIHNTRQWVSMYGNEKVLVLPQERPQFLSDREWDLVDRMCAREPDRRASMWYVLHQLHAFVSASATGDADSSDEHESYNRPNNIDDFIVRKMNLRVARAMPFLEDKCKEMPETIGKILKHLIDRLKDLKQVQSRENIEEGTTVVKGFVGVLDLLYDLLSQRHLGTGHLTSNVASFCASRAVFQKVGLLHHEIDRLLTVAEIRSAPASTPAALADTHGSHDIQNDSRDIHDWQLEWRKTRREQLRSFQACLKNTEELKRQLSDPRTRLEAQMLLQFELRKRRSSYPNSVLKTMSQALSVLDTTGDSTEVVPSWFIPPYEVVLGKLIAQGGFGDVYDGKWFDTEVVVKVMYHNEHLPAGTARQMELFRREADHWFMLSHQNVVQLYGACHIGIPFFVCERAKSTSLNSHLKSLACARPGYEYEEKGSDPADSMQCLTQVGIGLKYLHERGLVHCDLKGNNFMVGTDGNTIKLGDFGMSVLKRDGKGRHPADSIVSAVPWKAPEYLLGENPTTMSDVYSFGMCVLELISGKYPWDGVPEATVKFHVTKRKALPPRPKKLNDIQWSLIEHMCCFEPSKRISLDAAVDMLNTFRFE